MQFGCSFLNVFFQPVECIVIQNQMLNLTTEAISGSIIKVGLKTF